MTDVPGWVWGVAAVVVVLVFVVVTYNRLVRGRNQLLDAWAQIDVQLRRRYDLVPGLVAAVRGYAAHERAVLEAVTAARARAEQVGDRPAERSVAENRLRAALDRLVAVAEAYPQLRAAQNFALLAEELAATENRIAFARQHYNDAATEYNVAREQVPALLVAWLVGMRRVEYLVLDDPAAAHPPSVT